MYRLLLIVVVCSFALMSFWSLGSSSLVSWDEAWYAEISRNIIVRRDPVVLFFNGRIYNDHPPFGFWMISLSQLVFGYDEFAVRLPSVLFGIAGLVFVYLIGAKVSHPAVGVAAALGLSSSPWYLSRSRSGNLDIFLTTLFLAVFFLAIRTAQKKSFSAAFAVCLAALLLTKSVVPFSVFPSLLVVFWGQWSILLRLFIPGMAFVIWAAVQSIFESGFISHYFGIGLPRVKLQSGYQENINLTKSYLHYGIGSLFRTAVIPLPFAVFLVKNRFLLAIMVFIAVFLLPFAFSPKGQIWHLIPVFPFMLLLAFTVIFSILRRLHKKLAAPLLLTWVLWVSLPQVSRNYYEFINIPAYVSDEEILATRAKSIPLPLYIDERFVPTAVYYSQKTVRDLSLPDLSGLRAVAEHRHFLLITSDWRLAQSGLDPGSYSVIARDRDKLLVEFK